MEEKELKLFAEEIRLQTIQAIAKFGVGHIGGALSIADVLAVLYGNVMKVEPADPHWQQRDWLVLSKGHCGPALYAALAIKGYFPISQLETLNRPGTQLPSHCDMNLTPGIDMTTGSLGQGASTAAGVALGHKMQGSANRVFLILGDGEIQEGQVWEMALFAASRKLNNLIAFVDNNHLQLDDFTDNITSLGNIADKFQAFGWEVWDVDGHDVAKIEETINMATGSLSDKPKMIVLDTIKGKGWQEIENQIASHSKSCSEEEVQPVLHQIMQKMEVMGQHG